MEISALMWAIAHDQTVQQRIEALVREARWSGEGDPTSSVPTDQLAWAVATDPTIRDAVADRLDDGAPNSVADACAGITDAALSHVVLTSALPRLTS